MIKALFLLLFVVYTPETVPTDAGTYSVHISQTDTTSKIDTDFNLTVTEENTVIVENLAIDAKDFAVEEDIELSSDLIITMSKAKAWNIDTLESYDITEVFLDKVSEKQYQATLYSFDDINTTITINIVDDYYESLTLDEVDLRLMPYINNSLYKVLMLTLALIIILCYLLFFANIGLHNFRIEREIKKIKKAFTYVKKPK